MKPHPLLETYLTAVTSRDLGQLMPLIDAEVSLILPQGQLVTGRSEFELFHRTWFEDLDWNLQAELVKSSVSDQTAVFILNVLYLDKDRSGALVSYPYFLTLTFSKKVGKWSLVLDQNTPIHP